MTVTVGSNTKLNTIKGVAKILSVTQAELTTLANKVLPSNLLVLEPDGKVYLTDGVKTLAQLPVLIDQVVTEAEKGALNAAFSTGSYVAAAGGVVVHDANGKIDDGSLNLVENGKLKNSYLADLTDANGVVLVDKLPTQVRANVKYVADITARDALTGDALTGLVFVIDASADSTVDAGAAMYAWDASLNSGVGGWVKIAEHESLDIDVPDIECSYDNIVREGGVVYDHTLLVEAPTATDLVAKMEATAAGSGS